ncbi:endonuclease [Limnoglobus roseus]|uniref:Endonuclease n=1 Tax=Limnoglobus roseus TaxID=2598579 RepID=A0A5C1AAI8_9BACT|nr:endonuclease [Limnoglobus roseus]QEL15193.1 endonuclease [Limnoglobus roseus]
MPVLFLSLFLAAAGSSKLPLKPGWVAAATTASEHAHQAAAADDRFLYAVSSTHVARYDRTTGKLAGTGTTKDTKHLNSAFVWKGKVYCAHSNYPATPEASDIRVYDLADDSVKVHHTFEKPPGSLVWCVREPADQFWWCCFAHYGKDNPQTILLKMDEHFKELDRWTFPKIVVDDWDAMSASGGLWDGDTLLVTHHHFKVLYRLKLPAKGGELEFVEALTCPFPGQGIAVDPKVPGGLVGIDRDRKAIVSATKAK